MTKKPSKKMSKKRVLLIVTTVILCFLLAVILTIGIMTGDLLSGINRIDHDEETYSQEELDDLLDQSDTTPLIDHTDAIPTNKDVINVLLVGQDRREGQPRMHSDAMILCTINKKTKTLTMTSFLRDMWVFIPDHYNNRINVPYMLGGFDLLNKTLSYNFGVQADYNVEIDFSGFMTAIDMVGGVEIELTKAEADYLNRRGNWDVEENQHWNLTEGVTNLTGSQALAYSRIREIGNDFGRTNRQRTVLTALLSKIKGLEITKLYDLVKSLTPLLTTDMSNQQILGLMLEMIPILPELNVVSQRIPMDGEYYDTVKAGGAMVLALTEENLTNNKQLLIDAMKAD